MIGGVKFGDLVLSIVERYLIQCPLFGVSVNTLNATRHLNEKVGFKIPTTRYRKNSILCGVLHIGIAKWTSGVRWSFWTSRVARGIKGS